MADTPTRRLRPIHVVIAAVLLVAIGVLAYEWAHIVPTVAGKGPPTVASPSSTTPEQARAGAEGRSRDGANQSQDAYTAQNQSREPVPEAR
ncbi:MAG: hypothetical protein JF570_11985 [Caulobacter sp.]|jgi:hypothetical protein|nr:hypothetical protein [Caulobacter sp.]